VSSNPSSPGCYSGKTLLVTGASGFIGSHLVRRLGGGDAEIHAVARRVHEQPERGVRWWQSDLGDVAVVRDLLLAVRPDVIFHLAGHVVGARGLDVVAPTFRSNLTSTVNLLLGAGEVGCRRIGLTGSLEEPERGDPEGVPSSPYAAAKWAASAYARMFHALYQLPVVILRVFMVYGPAQQDVRKLIPYVTLSLLRGEAPRLTSGERPVDWIFVDDVVDGVLAAGEALGIDGGTIDLGSGELVSVRAVVQCIAKIIGTAVEPIFGAVPDRPFEQVRVANPADALAMLRWRPRVGLEDGLGRTVGWYAQRLREGSFR
jgi:nucleoside-diphosphate-sugar epimerase